MAGISNSIVVVNFNAQAALLTLIKSLRMEEATNSELIIVDNASFDSSLEAARAQHHGVRIVQRDDNRGFWAAANHGIDQAEGDIVVVAHADILTDVHNLAELADQLREAESRKTAAMLPNIVGVDSEPQPMVGTLPGLMSAMSGAIFSGGGLHCHAPSLDHLAENQWARFVCVALNRNLLSAVGSFDERFFLFFGDTDFCARMHAKQLRLLISKDVQVTHAGWPGGKGIAPHLVRILRNDRQKYAEKHLPGWQHGLVRTAGAIGALFTQSV